MRATSSNRDRPFGDRHPSRFSDSAVRRGVASWRRVDRRYEQTDQECETPVNSRPNACRRICTTRIPYSNRMRARFWSC